jgi:hypothetical protein
MAAEVLPSDDDGAHFTAGHAEDPMPYTGVAVSGRCPGCLSGLRGVRVERPQL